MGAADDGDVAEAALVGVVAAGRQVLRKAVGRPEAGGGSREQPWCDAEWLDPHLARMVAAIGRVQARLVAQEGDGVGRPHRDAVGTDHGAGVGIQSARHVQRQDRAVKFVERGHQLAVLALDRAREADAEQAVDDQPPLRIRGQHVDEADRAVACAFVRARRLVRGRALAGRVEHGRIDARVGEDGRHFQRIAAVVAGAGQQQDGQVALVAQ